MIEVGRGGACKKLFLAIVGGIVFHLLLCTISFLSLSLVYFFGFFPNHSDHFSNGPCLGFQLLLVVSTLSSIKDRLKTNEKCPVTENYNIVSDARKMWSES